MAPNLNYPDKLKDHKVVIIGGSKGIGLTVAEAFLSFGAQVVIVASTEKSLSSATSLLRSEFPSSSIDSQIADVTVEENITQALRKISTNGVIDHIVYTAVDARVRGPIADEDIEKAKDLFGVKFWGQVAVAKAIAKYDLIKPGGSYTITSGSLSLKPKPATAVGAAINGAVNSLAKGLAVDLAPKKIRVNAVIPGVVRDIHAETTPQREAAYKRSEREILTGFGIGTTEDIAETYLYFARAKFTTGTLALVDGGAIFSSAD